MPNDKTASSTRHRSFGARRKNTAKPLTFDLLDGKYEFEAKKAVQGAVILDFVASATGDGADSASHLVDFIFKVLKDDDERARFDAVIRSEDEDDIIEIEDLGDIVSWLVEEYTSRPTQES